MQVFTWSSGKHLQRFPGKRTRLRETVCIRRCLCRTGTDGRLRRIPAYRVYMSWTVCHCPQIYGNFSGPSCPVIVFYSFVQENYGFLTGRRPFMRTFRLPHEADVHSSFRPALRSGSTGCRASAYESSRGMSHGGRGSRIHALHDRRRHEEYPGRTPLRRGKIPSCADVPVLRIRHTGIRPTVMPHRLKSVQLPVTSKGSGA